MILKNIERKTKLPYCENLDGDVPIPPSRRMSVMPSLPVRGRHGNDHERYLERSRVRGTCLSIDDNGASQLSEITLEKLS